MPGNHDAAYRACSRDEQLKAEAKGHSRIWIPCLDALRDGLKSRHQRGDRRGDEQEARKVETPHLRITACIGGQSACGNEDGDEPYRNVDQKEPVPAGDGKDDAAQHSQKEQQAGHPAASAAKALLCPADRGMTMASASR